VWAAHTGEAFAQVAALEVGLDRLADDGAPKGKVSVVYDVAEKPWVEAGVFELTGSNTWKHQEIAIDKARFAGRCNGADIRLNLQNGARPTLRSVTVKMRQGTHVTSPHRAWRPQSIS
jgi:hypothetical protein